jgi:hypothetical protein
MLKIQRPAAGKVTYTTTIHIPFVAAGIWCGEAV